VIGGGGQGHGLLRIKVGKAESILCMVHQYTTDNSKFLEHL
jgi:hypothetical protein